MRYVATKYKVPKNWYPEDLEKNTRVLEYLFWHPTAIRKPEVDLFLDLVSILEFNFCFDQAVPNSLETG